MKASGPNISGSAKGDKDETRQKVDACLQEEREEERDYRQMTCRGWKRKYSSLNVREGESRNRRQSLAHRLFITNDLHYFSHPAKMYIRSLYS